MGIIPVATIDVADLPADIQSGLRRFGVVGLAPMVITGEARVVTGRSLWLIREDRYLRMPLVEAFRQAQAGIENRLDDNRWHPLREAWWAWQFDGWLRVRLLPVAGPADGVGVVTGKVTEYQDAGS